MVAFIACVAFVGWFAYAVYKITVGEKEDNVPQSFQSSQSVNITINVKKD